MLRKEIRFRKNLKQLRMKRGISQQELAEKIYVTRQTISNWERGFGKIDIYALHELCTLWGVSTDQMMYGTRWKK